jgi:hypothetical protein
MFASLTEIFCQIDDFCNLFDKKLKRFLLTNPNKKRQRACKLSLSEVMTVLILFHMSDYRTFKHFYFRCVLGDLKKYFPNCVSYSRFVQLTQYALLPLTIFLNGLRGIETGIYYVDSTPIEVCNIKREKRHKVFAGFASKGKSSMGWFFGFKLHLVINNLGEILSCNLTPGNVGDRTPVPKLMVKLSGWLFGDKGYLGQAFLEQLKAQSIEIFTKVKRNMKAKIMTATQKFYLSKRSLVETVIDQLKNCCQIEHSRHRKVENAFTSLVAGLVGYAFKAKKPTIKINGLSLENFALTSN